MSDPLILPAKLDLSQAAALHGELVTRQGQDVTIDLSHAHFWDITSVAALDKVVIKFRREGADVNVIGMNEATQTVVDKFGVHDKPEEDEKLLISRYPIHQSLPQAFLMAP